MFSSPSCCNYRIGVLLESGFHEFLTKNNEINHLHTYFILR